MDFCEALEQQDSWHTRCTSRHPTDSTKALKGDWNMINSDELQQKVNITLTLLACRRFNIFISSSMSSSLCFVASTEIVKSWLTTQQTAQNNVFTTNKHTVLTYNVNYRLATSDWKLHYEWKTGLHTQQGSTVTYFFPACHPTVPVKYSSVLLSRTSDLPIRLPAVTTNWRHNFHSPHVQFNRDLLT